MRQQAMPAGDIDDPAAAAVTAHPTRHLPGLEQFLSRQPPHPADDAAEAVEQCVAGETSEVVACESISGAVREAHLSIVAGRRAP